MFELKLAVFEVGTDVKTFVLPDCRANKERLETRGLLENLEPG